jgi:hypothetical protein
MKLQSTGIIGFDKMLGGARVDESLGENLTLVFIFKTSLI